MRLAKLTAVAAALALLGGCANWTPGFVKDPPTPFYGTRMLSAMIAGESDKLEHDFGMHPPPNLPERFLAGVMMPFTVATETAFYPLFIGLRLLSPKPDPAQSG